MKLETLVPLWMLLPFVIVLGVALWQLWRVRKKGKTLVLRWARRVAIVVLLILVCIGPSVQGGKSSLGVANLDVIFAVDTTPSMGAMDYNGESQRMEGVRNDILALAQKMEGASFEVITFDASANLIVPFTNDMTVLKSGVQGLVPDVSAYSLGTSPDKPVSAVVDEFKTSKKVDPERKRLLFYLGDGEKTTSGATESFEPIKQYLSGGAVLGYGTPEGARVVKYSGPGEIPDATSYLLTLNPASSKMEPVVSKADSASLESIAQQMKLTYHDRNESGSIDDVYSESRVPLSIDESKHIVHYFNLYWLFAIPLTVLIFWEWQILVVTLLKLRKKKGAHRG